jgi:chromosome segregation ATPase
MVNLKGRDVDLADLFGYSKLQDVLETLIKSANDQDESAKALHDSVLKKLTAQDAVVKQVQQECKESADIVKKAKAEQDQLAARVGKLEQKMVNAEASLVSYQGDLGQMKAQLQVLSTDVNGCQGLLGVHEARLKDLESDSSKAKLNDLEQALADRTSALGERLSRVEDRTGRAETQLADHAKQHGSHVEQITALSALADQVRADLAAGIGSVDERLKVLEADFPALKASVEDSAGGVTSCREELKKTAEALARLEAQLKELRNQSQQDGVMRKAIEALTDKEAADVKRLEHQVQALMGKMTQFEDKGASGTARCLSCYSRRAQLTNSIVIGSDGKTYLKSAEGASVGRLNMSSPVRGGSPPRAVPLPSSHIGGMPSLLMRTPGAMSTGSLDRPHTSMGF